MAALRVLAPQLQEPQLDAQIINALWSICHTARAWGVHEDGMLRRNDLISPADVERLESWIEDDFLCHDDSARRRRFGRRVRRGGLPEHMNRSNLLAISGSLRAASSNTALRQAATSLASAKVNVEIYQNIGALPHFNPDDDEDDAPAIVADLRARVVAADGLIICTPEYVHGLPGSLKICSIGWSVAANYGTNRSPLLASPIAARLPMRRCAKFCKR